MLDQHNKLVIKNCEEQKILNQILKCRLTSVGGWQCGWVSEKKSAITWHWLRTSGTIWGVPLVKTWTRSLSTWLNKTCQQKKQIICWSTSNCNQTHISRPYMLNKGDWTRTSWSQRLNLYLCQAPVSVRVVLEGISTAEGNERQNTKRKCHASSLRSYSTTTIQQNVKQQMYNELIFAYFQWLKWLLHTCSDLGACGILKG